MTWARMRFKDQVVLVRVDEAGKPVLDADGRAEMKYREADTRSYRPAPGNLVAAPGEAAVATKRASAPVRPKAATTTATLASPGDVVHVWTDGACTGNPGPMGIGVVVIGPGGARKERGEYLGHGTNNIAELVAIERGLEIAQELFPGDGRRVRVYSDSSYSIGLLSQGWKAKANQDLVARLRQKVDEFPELDFVKVKGHAGVPENERCDELARTAILTKATT